MAGGAAPGLVVPMFVCSDGRGNGASPSRCSRLLVLLPPPPSPTFPSLLPTSPYFSHSLLPLLLTSAGIGSLLPLFRASCHLVLTFPSSLFLSLVPFTLPISLLLLFFLTPSTPSFNQVKIQVLYIHLRYTILESHRAFRSKLKYMER